MACCFLLLWGSWCCAAEQRFPSVQTMAPSAQPNTIQPNTIQPSITPAPINSPRFYMVENGKVQTAEDFDRWLKNQGLTIMKGPQREVKMVEPPSMLAPKISTSDVFTAPVWAGEPPTVTIVPFSGR